MTLLERFARRGLCKALASVRYGRVVVEDELGSESFAGSEPGPEVRVVVHESAFYAQAALRGTIGAAESFMEGEWEADDLVALVRLLVANREVMLDMESGLARLARPFLAWYHARRRNTRAGSRRNISEHYDLGNEFFGLFLDPTMMYSAAVYEREDMTLEEAQQAKLERICRKLRLGPEDHLLEIGTGWGGLAIHAASRYGCRVTTTTISREQHAEATRRVIEAGLKERVNVLLEDYRALEGSYDKLVSIEMIEAVGHQYFGAFFERISALLKPEGLALVQAITIRDDLYESARREVDFIKRYIFPGCCIPSLAALSSAMARSSDLRVVGLDDISESYALTLRAWRERFMARIEEVRAQGFSERFARMWEFYLAYCEGGFLERQIGDLQLLFAKPRYRGVDTIGAAGLPA